MYQINYSSQGVLLDTTCVLRLLHIHFNAYISSCHFGNGEYRRCLALLEQRNLLSAATLSGLGALLRPDSDDPKENKFINVNIDDRPDPPSMNTLRPFSQSPGLATHRESIDAVQLAARALVALGQYEDCLLLVEAVVAVEEGTLASIAVLQCRRLLGKSSIQTSARPIEDKSAGQVHGQAASSSSCIGNDNDNGNGRTKPSSTGINPMSGLSTLYVSVFVSNSCYLLQLKLPWVYYFKSLY